MSATDDSIAKHFPAYMRLDAENWSFWKFWPGAALLLLPRLFISAVMLVTLWFLTCIILLGHEAGTPVLGCRKRILRFIYPIFCRVGGVLIFGTWFSSAYEKIDYSEYLGKEEVQTQAR